MEPIDLSHPLTALRQFHQLTDNVCDALDALADSAESGADAASLRGRAGEIQRHFSASSLLHHKDEEEDLFPILARQSLKLADRVHQARRDHERLDHAWEQLGPVLRDAAAIAADPTAFADQARAFTAMQRSHCHHEEEALFAVAEHILGQKELADLSKSMKKRRGLV